MVGLHREFGGVSGGGGFLAVNRKRERKFHTRDVVNHNGNA